MKIKDSNKINTRLFAGCYINSEIRMHLNQSIHWKHAAIHATTGMTNFQEVHFQGKDYIGSYIKDNKLTIKELNRIQEIIIDQLKIYCSNLEIENINICIFPQLFIA